MIIRLNKKTGILSSGKGDSLATLITSRIMAGEKLDYIHFNPLQPHWQLAKDPTEYRFSSARFYETGVDEFKILTHYMDKL